MDVISTDADYLGPTWVATTFRLKDDDGGRPPEAEDVAVLVHEQDAAALAKDSEVAALYLPGFIDSFFHVEQAAALRKIGVPLIGLDFRRCGRSVKSENSRDDLRDIYVREEEISEAIEYVRGTLGARKIVLIGHSTGGLQAALWAADHPGTVDAVVLNSPWLDHNGPAYQKGVLTRIVGKIAKRHPRFVISRLGTDYARSLHQDYGGEFFFEPAHKPLTPCNVYAGFFTTVRRAHARIASTQMRIEEPLLLLHSSRSGNFARPTPEDLASSDVVLNVEDMTRLVPRLNPEAKIVSIEGGRHDLALSEFPARRAYTEALVSWVRETLGIEA